MFEVKNRIDYSIILTAYLSRSSSVLLSIDVCKVRFSQHYVRINVYEFITNLVMGSHHYLVGYQLTR